jgi:translation initiation factor IF-2
MHAVERVSRAPLRAQQNRPLSLPTRDERLSENTQHMSETDPSGTPAPAPVPAPAENAAAPAAPATQPFGTFGSTRGSGLARGKRATVNAAPASAPSGFKPSALEVITPKSEYVNPFTGETTVSSPVVNEPAPQAAPAPVSAPAPVAPVAQVAPAPAPAPAAPTAELFPFKAPSSPASAAEPAAKPELNILPPQEAKRPAVSWEAPSANAAADAPAPRRDDRATFRTERNRRDNPTGGSADARPAEGREPRKFEPREPRRDERKFEPRTNQPYQPRGERTDRPARTEAPAPEKKSGGFFGWLKGLFGGKKAEAAPAPSGDREPRRDGERGGDRRDGGRGGRGRDRGGYRGDNRGPRDPNFQHPDPREEGPEGQGGGGDYHGDGGGRRRRRGGRGRFRGEGGDRGDRGGPRPEGQQGGGAI